MSFGKASFSEKDSLKPSFIVALIEYRGQLMAFDNQSNNLSESIWSSMPIKGEARWSLGETMTWPKALEEISAQFTRSTGLADGWVYFVVSQVNSELLELLLHQAYDLSRWNLLRWSWLLDHEALDQEQLDAAPIDWISEHLLPWLTPQTQKFTRERIHHSVARSPEDDLVAELAREKGQLQEDNANLEKKQAQLEERLDYMQRRLENQSYSSMDTETLVTFLPVLYRNFWTHIRPDELALLAGSLHIPEIPSPVREPNPGIVQGMKKRLRKLSPEQKNQLLAFCRQLPLQPEIRSEMQFFFQDNDL